MPLIALKTPKYELVDKPKQTFGLFKDPWTWNEGEKAYKKAMKSTLKKLLK